MIVFDGCRDDGIVGSRRPPVSCELMTDVWWPRRASCRRWLQPCDELYIMRERHVAKPWPVRGRIFETLYHNIWQVGVPLLFWSAGPPHTTTHARVHSCIWLSEAAQFAQINKAGGEQVILPFKGPVCSVYRDLLACSGIESIRMFIVR